MRIVLNHAVSGTRDGEPWPEPGTAFEIPDDEAVLLLRNGIASPEGDAAVEAASVDTTPRKRGKSEA